MFSKRDIRRYDKTSFFMHQRVQGLQYIHYYINMCIFLLCMLLIKIEGLIFVSTEPFYDIITDMLTYKKCMEFERITQRKKIVF